MLYPMTRIETLRSTFWIWAGLIIALLATQVAGAAAIRTIASTGEASSECIGDPRTPLCALDTWNACFLWTEPQLCEKVGLEGVDFREDEIGSKFEWAHTFRRIAVRPIEARHLAEIESGHLIGPRPEQDWFRAGYIEIRWTQRRCFYRDPGDCSTYDGEGVLIVKPVRDEWHISGWWYGGDDLTCRDYVPARDDPWRHFCTLNIAAEAFLAYEASRRSAK